jgi:hypothetical protein
LLLPEVCVIVHDVPEWVASLGFPLESEREDAVTEPWMLYPPLRAKSPAGQLTVKVFDPDVTLAATETMVEPLMPLAPAGP